MQEMTTQRYPSEKPGAQLLRRDRVHGYEL